MDFTFTEEQQAIRDSILKICEKYDDDYWLARDASGEFPVDFHREFADGGWLGIAMPEEYGGAGLGVVEACIMMQAVAESGAAQSGASAIHLNIFGPNPIVIFGNEEQKKRFLPPLIKGEEKACFAVTEPDAGLETTALKSRAVLNGDHYVVNGKKVWTSTAQIADRMLIILRTTPQEDCKKRTDGLTLFYTKLDRNAIDVREIEKMGRKCVDSNEMFIDNLKIPVEDRIGEEGRGFHYLLHGLNPERVLIGAEAVGIGKVALARATQYAKDRVVFSRPIGQNQAIQHPLAENWLELEAANMMVFKAAAMYDAGLPCGAEANGAKFLGARAGFNACQQAILTHGGYGYAKEFHVERFMRESMISRIAPVSEQMILNYIGEQVLGLPRSY